MRIFIFLFLISFYSSVYAANSDMQAISCAPNGIANVIKEKVDPKGFWVKQATFSEGMLNYLRYGEGAGPDEIVPTEEGCIAKSQGDRIEREKCITYVRNEINFWVRCGAHAKKMCRLHGGNC